MSDRNPRTGANKVSDTAARKVVPSETQVARATATPVEDDPAWVELGRTCVVKANEGDASAGDSASTSNHTEFSASRVLGKNLVKIGDYLLKKKLGEGAMGAVYQAEQISRDNRTVALKILFPHVANNPKLVARMEREAHVMGLLDHPNIIQAFDYDVADGCHYVAMEYVAGKNTQKWLEKVGKFPVGDAVHIALVCARALAYAHAQNMIHRDIKPENILLTKTGIVKVADLGMVKTEDEEMSLTQTGHAVGTPWYMPLEQARNAKEIDCRSDIYALGCTLYAFLTGRPPFVGKTIVDVIQAKEVGTFPPARQANPEVPERLDLILAKMIAKQPKHRYQSCEEVIKDLESLGLASDKVSFMQERPVARPKEDDDVSKMVATVETAMGKSQFQQTPADGVATVDPNTWYLQVKSADGVAARKYTTAQLQKMLTDGVIKPNARISRSESDGFRAVATFKEFQGQALAKATKKAADKQTSRYRNIYKKIDEKDRAQQAKERADNEPESAVQATTRYWLELTLKGLPIGLGIMAFVSVLYWLGTTDVPLAVPIVPAVAFVGSVLYAIFGRR